MAIRFTSYEWYKQLLANKETGAVSGQATFFGPCNPHPKLFKAIQVDIIRTQPASPPA